ncbi:MAG: Gfo/Idh/MocA family protein [Bryobacteraceae bacterium]
MWRREFLSGAALGASAAVGAAKAKPPSERVALGFIGVGTRGADGLLKTFLKLNECDCLAVCDPMRDRRDKWTQTVEETYGERKRSGLFKGCNAYNDFREVLQRSDLDAVVIATPDHWHVPIATAAARAGKDMYVEKPLGLSISQNLAARRVIRENKRIFQYGTQQRGAPHVRFGCELIRSGRLGKIHSIEVWAPAGSPGGATAEMPVPDGFDYNLWLGPAPVKPYNSDRCLGVGRYFIYDYSIGFLGGWGAHPLDVLDWALPSPSVPVEFEGLGSIPTDGLFDTVTHWFVRARFADGVTLNFTHGTDYTRVAGSEGWVAISRTGLASEPKSLISSYTGPIQGFSQTKAHCEDFLQAVKQRRDPAATIESAVRSDLISHLSDIAIRTGRKIRWDPAKETIHGDSAAARMCTRPMRAPWTV